MYISILSEEYFVEWWKLAYADDVDIIGRSICEVEASFSKFAEEAQSIGLAVNESKTKLLLSTARLG